MSAKKEAKAARSLIERGVCEPVDVTAWLLVTMLTNNKVFVATLLAYEGYGILADIQLSKRDRHKENVVRKEAKRVQRLIEAGEGESTPRWVHSSKFASMTWTPNSRRDRRNQTEKDWET